MRLVSGRGRVGEGDEKHPSRRVEAANSSSLSSAGASPKKRALTPSAPTGSAGRRGPPRLKPRPAGSGPAAVEPRSELRTRGRRTKVVLLNLPTSRGLCGGSPPTLWKILSSHWGLRQQTLDLLVESACERVDMTITGKAAFHL